MEVDAFAGAHQVRIDRNGDIKQQNVTFSTFFFRWFLFGLLCRAAYIKGIAINSHLRLEVILATTKTTTEQPQSQPVSITAAI